MKFYRDIVEAHPNSKIYDKCWDGHRKVPGKTRGEKGSCKKISTEAYDAWDEADVWYQFDTSTKKLKQKTWYHAQEREARANGWHDSHDKAMQAHGYFPSKFKKGEYVIKGADDKWIKVYPYADKTVKEFAPAGRDPQVIEGQQLSIQQLATISDEALDKAYKYGRSSPGNTFGWQANLKSAQYAKQMIDKGVTDIEAISDAIHNGWNVTAQAFVQNPEQFDDTAKLQTAGKLEAKLQQRAELMKKNYSQLPEDEKEKDRVVARALLQAIKGEQGVAEGRDGNDVEEFLHKVAQSGDNGYDMLYNAQKGKYGQEIERAIQDMYDNVSIDTGYHGDDDFEQIYDRMLDNIGDDYGQQGVAEGDDDEEDNDEGFFVAIGNERDGGFVGMINKDGGKWRETAIDGDPPHNWGGSYMSYLTTQDVMHHIKNDYRNSDVGGPFDSEEKAKEYAYTNYGLGDSDDYDMPESDSMPVRGDDINITMSDGKNFMALVLDITGNKAKLKSPKINDGKEPFILDLSKVKFDIMNDLDEQGVVEGNSGAKYKIKIIGRDKNGDYYISPSTGKKVYKSGVKRGDHENPKTGEHKGVAEGLDSIPATLYHATYRPLLKSIKKYGLGGDRAQAKWEDSKPGVVYLAVDPNVAESYAETSDVVPEEWLDEIVILKISTVGLDKNKFDIDRNVQDNTGDTIEYTGIIPISNISLIKKGVAEGDGDHQIRPGMKVSQGTVVKVDGNTVVVKTSNGDMMTMNIHDIQQGMAEDSLEEIDRRGFLQGMGAAAVAGVGGVGVGVRKISDNRISEALGNIYGFLDAINGKDPESYKTIVDTRNWLDQYEKRLPRVFSKDWIGDDWYKHGLDDGKHKFQTEFPNGLQTPADREKFNTILQVYKEHFYRAALSSMEDFKESVNQGVAEVVSLDRSKNPNYPNDPATVKHRLDTARAILNNPNSDPDSLKAATAIVAAIIAKSKQGMAEGGNHNIGSMMQQYEDMVELVYDLLPGRKKNLAIDKRDALEAQIEAMPGGKEALQMSWASKWSKSYTDAIKDKKITKETQAVADNSLGYKNTLAVMKAADSSQEATINLGGEPVTLDYPEARFIAGKYKAFLRAGRQEEFFGYMSNSQQFDSMMKQLRNLIDKQKNFKGSVPGERGVDEGWKSALGAAAMAGTMALGSAGANARVTSDGQGGFTGGLKPTATMTAPADKKPAAEAPKGFSKEYLQSVVDGKHPRPMVSVEKAQELLKNMQESTDYEKSIPAGADEHRVKWKCPYCGVASGIVAFRINNYKCPSCEEPLPLKGQMGLKHQKSVSEDVDSPVAGAITRRIMSQRLDLLKQYGPNLVMAAIDDVADYVGDVEEIGSSDVSAWVTQVERMLKKNPPQAFTESLRLVGKHSEGAKTAKVYKDHEWGEYRVKFYSDGKHEGESADYHTDDRDDANDTAKSWISKGKQVVENTYWCRQEKTRKLIPEGYKKTAKGYITKV